MTRTPPSSVLLLALLTSCRSAPEPAPSASDGQGSATSEGDEQLGGSPWTETPAAGVTHPALAALLLEHWESTMAQSPTWATQLGDHRYDDRLHDPSHEAVLARRQLTRGFLERARAIEAASLDDADRVTHTLFVDELASDVATEVCEFHLWNISAMSNPLTRHSYLPRLHHVESAQDGENLLARYRAMPAAIDAEVRNLERGVAAGRFANAETARRIIAMIRAAVDEPLPESPLVAPATEDHETWDDAALTAFRQGIETTVRDGIRPALGRYADYLESAVLPVGRDEAHSGVSEVTGGEACYRAQIRAYTGLDHTAQRLHEVGLSEMTRITGQMQALGEQLFETRELPAILERMRTDETLYFTDSAAVVQKAEEALAAAQARMPEFFGITPEAPCVVVPIPDYEAPFTTIAYYRPPHADGSKPGEFFVNTYEPRTRPRYGMQALTFHESIPGHHLQIAIAQELEALPVFRRHLGLTAYVEGWALYTERLADEMGLYSGPLDRLGMLSYEAWRAARLVVDTGLHALGWSRERAVEYMLAHTALAENNVRNEVDRYISWPAQALAYKVGQLEILRLRAEAREVLGDEFQLRDFHDVVLRGGAVSLRVLEANVRAWRDAAPEQ